MGLFMQVIKCIGGDASRSYIDYFTDILLALNKKYFDNLCRYMNSMVSTDNFATELCSREAKEHFARSVLKERATKENCKKPFESSPCLAEDCWDLNMLRSLFSLDC